MFDQDKTTCAASLLTGNAWRAVAALDVDALHEHALAEPDPGQGLRQAAAIQRRQFEAMYDVIAVYAEAARVDPDIAEDTGRIQTNRERAFRRHVDAIAEHLAPGLTVDQALDVYLTLVLPEVYRTLVVERAWSAQRYETWLGQTLTSQLLGPADAT